MGKRKRIALVGLLAVVLVGLTWVVLRPPGVKEPVYEGKPLSYWLDGPPRDRTNLVTIWFGPPFWAKAIVNVGTNAVPWLLQESSAHELGLVTFAKGVLNKQLQVKTHLVTASEHQERAKRGFTGLGVAGGLAVTQGLTNSDKWIRFGCVGQWEIGKKYPDIYIPALMGRLKDPDADVRGRAANALGLMDHQQDEKIVPALIEALDDPDDSVRAMAALGLSCIGKPAKAAVPALMKHLSNSTPNFQFFATNALRSIGPVTAAAQASGK